ncbi:dihydroorotate dehydrogenase-like protein [Spirochaeta africana]|uniref:dihydrouracil dehydrogenase (NAD(+)) n=1 Tax=Spirochaeta africana (strain ATCC 700263 / DSM 8902 / Z-7692) TaxID=889378 RepID=H9UGJ9_SPIAZ|nr:dihydroorotate dehydrogenase-like protein [Spirochaeta africana]AFG36642.1 dihydroorotate dehydrogenase [Spirochaeta africana DSM 8902]
MANLQTTYMGIPVRNPLVVGACSLTSHMDSIKKVEEAGAGALVISSLFEEQINLQKARMEEELSMHDNLDAEMGDLFPDVEHGGPQEHLYWVKKAKEAVSIPVIASLNCTAEATWVEWAKKLEDTGVDGLELNFFALPLDADQTAEAVESQQLRILQLVLGAVKVPVSVKLSPFYTSPLNVVKRMSEAGVKGAVLFNRMFHPTFDIEKEASRTPFNLSHSDDHRLPLRYAGLLHDAVSLDVCSSNGIHSSKDAVEVLLAGAQVFQVVSTLYKNKLEVIQSIVGGIEKWMDGKGYADLDAFRGKLSAKNTNDRWDYRRAQYVRTLLNADQHVARPAL